MSNDLLNNAELLVINDEVKNPHSKYRKLLKNVQGHILKDNGRDHSVHIFLKFKKADSAKIRTMIQQLASATFPLANKLVQSQSFHYLPSASEQLLIRKLVIERDKKLVNKREEAACEGTYFVNFYLSKQGYKALGFSGSQLPPDHSYQRGLKTFLQDLVKRNKLTEAQLKQTDPKFENIHAMIAISY